MNASIPHPAWRKILLTFPWEYPSWDGERPLAEFRRMLVLMAIPFLMMKPDLSYCNFLIISPGPRYPDPIPQCPVPRLPPRHRARVAPARQQGPGKSPGPVRSAAPGPGGWSGNRLALIGTV